MTSLTRTYPAFNARLGLVDLDQLNIIFPHGNYETLNRFLADVSLGVIDCCQSTPFSFGNWGAKFKLLCYPIVKPVWCGLANADLRRTLISTQTKPVKLSFPRTDRERLSALSRQLRWAEGQVLLECFQACAVMAGAQAPLESLPDIILLSRARRVFCGESPSETMGTLLGQLNLELGLIRRSKLEPVAGPAQKMKSEIELG